MEFYVYVATDEETIRDGGVVTIIMIYTATILLTERFIRYLHVVLLAIRGICNSKIQES